MNRATQHRMAPKVGADGDDADGNNVENFACFFCSINKKLLDKMEKRTQFLYFTGQADVWKILIFDG